MHRAYSLLHVKSVDVERRRIRGIATTPEPDRTGDVIEPLGASFPDEIPLLLHHRKDAIYRPVTDLPPTTVGLAWLVDNDDARVQMFIGIVRGRTERSSRT